MAVVDAGLVATGAVVTGAVIGAIEGVDAAGIPPKADPMPPTPSPPTDEAVVAIAAPARTFPALLQNPSRSMIIERLCGAAVETKLAHVDTGPSKPVGTQAVLVGLTLL
jgi:hypothetical protein